MQADADSGMNSNVSTTPFLQDDDSRITPELGMNNSHGEILTVVEESFRFSEKPSSEINPTHCDECRECHDYVTSLNPGDITLEDIRERWQFGFCGHNYRRYLFPGVCRECLACSPPDLEFLFAYLDPRLVGELDCKQQKVVRALYQYLFDCGFALENEPLHRQLRERLKTTPITSDETPA